MTWFGNDCFEVCLVDLYQSCSQFYFSDIGFNYFYDFCFFVVESRVNLMGPNPNSDTLLNPLEFFFLFLYIFIIFLQLLIHLLNFLHFLGMNLVTFSNFFFNLIGSVQCRSFNLRFKTINIEFQFIRNNNIQTFFLQLFQFSIQKILLSFSQFFLFFNSRVDLFLKLLFLLLPVFQSFLFHCVLDEIFCFVNDIYYFAIGRSAHNFDISYFLKILAKLSQIFPLRMIEFQKLFFLHKFIIQLLKIFRLARILGLQHLHKSALKLFGSSLNMFQRIACILPNFLLMT